MLSRYICVACAALGVSACGGGAESGGPGSSGPIELEDLAEPLTDAVCAFFARCVPIPAEDQFPGGCKAYELPRVAGGTVPQFQELVRTGRVAYDAARMATCLESYRTMPCAAREEDIADCLAALHGTVAVGGACRLEQECANDADCDTSASCPGTCVVRGSVGTTCASSSECATGLTCATGVCAERGALGAACGGTEGTACAPMLACVGSTAASAGKCQEYVRGDVGAVCDWNNGNLCKAGLSCAAVGSGTTGGQLLQCVANSRSGGTCSVGLQDSCPLGEFCPLTAADRTNGTYSATCKPYGVAGSECVTSSFACGPVGNCSTDGRCVTLGKPGDPCKEDGDCVTDRCSAGACALNLGCE